MSSAKWWTELCCIALWRSFICKRNSCGTLCVIGSLLGFPYLLLTLFSWLCLLMHELLNDYFWIQTGSYRSLCYFLEMSVNWVWMSLLRSLLMFEVSIFYLFTQFCFLFFSYCGKDLVKLLITNGSVAYWSSTLRKFMSFFSFLFMFIIDLIPSQVLSIFFLCSWKYFW